jgi:hypothetical protein
MYLFISAVKYISINKKLINVSVYRCKQNVHICCKALNKKEHFESTIFLECLFCTFFIKVLGIKSINHMIMNDIRFYEKCYYCYIIRA